MKARKFLQGLGAAALVMSPVYGPVVNHLSGVRMHTPAPLTMFALSLITNLLLVSLLLALAAIWLGTHASVQVQRVLLPGAVLATLAEAIWINWRGFESLHLWLIVWAAITALAVLLQFVWQRGQELLFRVGGAALMGMGFYCLYVVLQLVHLAMWRPLPNFTAHMPTGHTSDVDRPRILWILFDELSYDQVFEHRYAGLRLPNLDKLRQSSTLFTHTLPVATVTEKAVASILLGQPVTRIVYTPHNELEVAFANKKLHPFDSSQTPFATARKNGLTTGVDGWYNPYCSSLAPYLNQCYWTDELVVPSAFTQEGFWQNLLDPWERYVDIFFRARHRKSLSYRVRLHQDLMLHANQMLQSSGPDFVFLHLPLPHPPGIYDRNKQRFDTSGERSYIDNLALTDRSLGELLTIVEHSRRWKATSVVISGDHSWRVYSWRHLRYWTEEDQAASRRDFFDQRPLIMVHLPSQTRGETVDAPFPLVQLHAVLDDLVQGKRPSFESASTAK